MNFNCVFFSVEYMKISGLTNVKCECTYTAQRTIEIIHLVCNHKVIYFRPLNGHKSNFHIKTGARKTIRGKPI